MKRFKKTYIAGAVIVAFLGLAIIQACKKTFLDAQPYGQYTPELIKNKKDNNEERYCLFKSIIMN